MYDYPSGGPVRSRLSYWARFPYETRFRWGLVCGWFSAACLSLFVLIEALAGLSLPSDLRPARVLLAYWIAGTAVGLVLGVAHPLARSRFGSFMLGAVLGWFVYAICGVVNGGWDRSFLIFAVFPALLVGGGSGIWIYQQEHSAPRAG